MNAKKFAFIMCANNEQYVEEAAYYIKRLRIPEGYEAEINIIRGASGMAAGYNQAMRSSDAKYKIYLHQDVMIIERDFLEKLLAVFTDKKVGMIGMVGSPKLPENAVMWYGERIGTIYSSSPYFMVESRWGDVKEGVERVEAVDGLLMATQYDVPWREDLFKNWDFYDISQCQEFIKSGYDVVVPEMETPWCIHDCGASEFEKYFEERKKFMCEYKNLY